MGFGGDEVWVVGENLKIFLVVVAPGRATNSDDSIVSLFFVVFYFSVI